MEKIIDFITDNFPWFAIGFIVLIGLVAYYEEAYYPCKEYKDVVAYTMPSYIYQNGFSIPFGGGVPYMQKTCVKR